MTLFDGNSRNSAAGASAASRPQKHAPVVDGNLQVRPSLELLSPDRTTAERQEPSFSGEVRSMPFQQSVGRNRSDRERYVTLSDDVEVVALADLPESVRRHLDGGESDFVVVRPYWPTQVIDSCAAALIAQFERPKTIVDAILAYSRKIQVRPSDVLEYAFPLIQGFILAGVLVRQGEQACAPET